MKRAIFVCGLALAAACSSSLNVPDGGTDAGNDAGADGGHDAGPPFDGGFTDAGIPDGGFCALPGTTVYASSGRYVTDGGAGANFSWLKLPNGFCAHEFATVPDARQLRFAPGGELFVTSPTTGTTGGNTGNAYAAIVVLPDDNHDGTADQTLHFKDGLPSTQGMLFANGFFYYQDHAEILREPYLTGQRADNGQSVVVADITYYQSGLHWPKTLDISDTGTIYVGNGGDQGESCVQPMPMHGGILTLDGGACPGTEPNGNCGTTPIVKGLRNPIAVKCHRDGHDRCYATELALDYSATGGGREKLIPIHAGDNWGFPCCATFGAAYPGLSPTPDCSGVTKDTNSFIIGNTPFGFDFEDALFPSPWDHKVLVALHGEAGSWSGARVVAIATDPSTGEPYPSSTTSSMGTGNIADFAIGWDDGTLTHGRPADVEVSPDGRVFIANDTNGQIFWIAHVQ
jgi:glucose/arabinose dehydrogenase